MFKNINKGNIIKALSVKTGFSANFSKKLIEDLIQIIIQNIKADELVLKNLGSFKLIQKNERVGRNPKTKEEFSISPRKSISFTPSKNLIEKLNKDK